MWMEIPVWYRRSYTIYSTIYVTSGCTVPEHFQNSAQLHDFLQRTLVSDLRAETTASELLVSAGTSVSDLGGHSAMYVVENHGVG